MIFKDIHKEEYTKENIELAVKILSSELRRCEIGFIYGDGTKMELAFDCAEQREQVERIGKNLKKYLTMFEEEEEEAKAEIEK